MKRLIFKLKTIALILTVLVSTGFESVAQQQLPLVIVRFANPQYDCETQLYCVDVEFLADVPDLELFSMNLRFFYDDDVLEYLSIGPYTPGYEGGMQPVNGFEIFDPPIGTDYFGIGGPLFWFNGYYRKISFDEPTYLSTNPDEWTKLFKICFTIDDPAAFNIDRFCPTLIWDMQVNPADGGYNGPGDDGVQIIIVGPPEAQTVRENVVQFNWAYNPDYDPEDENTLPFGFPVETDCVNTTCGYTIPVANWAIFLAIGLMLVASVFIYRRRV